MSRYCIAFTNALHGLVFDQAISAKIQHIRWKNEEFRKKFIIRLGDFHTVMSFCGAIGKLFGDTGLQVKYFAIYN
jgi:hypothetical protein